MLTRQMKFQLAVLAAVICLAGGYVFLSLVNLPTLLFGVGRYEVTMELSTTGGLYEGANVTYRGTEVGRVQSVQLTDDNVEATLSLKSGLDIPSDLKAEVHSQSAIGEQYVALLPRNGDSPPLKKGDVIPLSATSTPPDINALLSATNDGLLAIPHDSLKTVVDESFTAVGGLGPELSRLVDGGTNLAIDARKNLDPLVALIDQSKPVLDSQSNSAEAIQAWAANLATVTSELKTHDQAIAGVVSRGAPALDETRQLVERLQPTLPTALANLASIGQVGLDYHSSIEQLLVVFPQLVANQQASIVANANTKQDYASFYINLALNLNVPPACLTGYLPAQQKRSPVLEDSPPFPEGEYYCRVPQDSQINVRGARNLPCQTRPGKRAATVKLCESDEQYVPLNDGFNWKGDPNATTTGQSVPHLPPGLQAPTDSTLAPIEAVLGSPPPTTQSDPATVIPGGPIGETLAQAGSEPSDTHENWQSMLLPPGS